MKLFHICNPENRRAEFLREACRKLSRPLPVEIPWIDFLQTGELPDFSENDIIRIESPGESFQVEKRLIEKGGGPVNLEEDHGRLRYQTAWYRGWSETLREIGDRGEPAKFINHPEDIRLMFDKYRCQQHLADKGVSIPDLLGQVTSFDHLMQLMSKHSASRVFLKPAHSSSASGVVALQIASGDRIQATTSAELIGDRIYNSLRIRQYREIGEVRLFVDTLCRENIYAERWFPKASLSGKTFDLRVVVINGKACHTVVRTSRSPITNLHLGNERGDGNAVLEAIGEATWNSAMANCEAAANCFRKSHYTAVDLMINTGKTSVAVAEVNAFGDLLPYVLSDGDDTYTAELRSFLR